MLADAAEITRFASGRRQDLTDLDYEARFADLLSRCEYVGDSADGKRTLIVAVAPVITATRGPANENHEARVDYFVTVVDRAHTILNKQIFTLNVGFPGNRTRVVVKDDDPPITVDIPLAEGTDGRGYGIIVGFQLTPEELEYNRRRRGALR